VLPDQIEWPLSARFARWRLPANSLMLMLEGKKAEQIVVRLTEIMPAGQPLRIS
jgi:hypothetical protein